VGKGVFVKNAEKIYATAFAAGIKKLNQLVLNCAKIKFFLANRIINAREQKI